jgi:hypothetical protein
VVLNVITASISLQLLCNLISIPIVIQTIFKRTVLVLSKLSEDFYREVQLAKECPAHSDAEGIEVPTPCM